ncbi:MAG TPA: hypothetical protein VMZ53_16330 [Kofleriaceae bacterium]|nr:hypothetical protein [Kofleriaceae bacterium]
MYRLAVASLIALGLTGCHHAQTSPELRVLGVHQESHVFVQVTNPAQRPLHLTKLDYVFASSKGTTIAEGSMPIERDIPGGAVAVLEVPLDADTSEPVTLRGKLTGELDQIVRTFKLNAQIAAR